MDSRSLAAIVIAFFIFIGFVIWVESSSEARMVESCISAGGEWVDLNSSNIVNMGCKK